ncbi:hypothetical protein CFELI_04305 [Corynebacterium felinum]|uniref:Uncharacterized protein n=1 Tax=Corynebacterium felinum TaxID=131318 RepID=A0ABU2B945_9CORY|nr:hypothetical protein [Corynebacterium felinum]WJY94493.1 hypothetical protein CFELI_04305 [Corynebacterium felinum]
MGIVQELTLTTLPPTFVGSNQKLINHYGSASGQVATGKNLAKISVLFLRICK